jgi:hypothetical protein
LNEDLNIDDDLNQLNKDKVNDEFSDVNNVDDVDDVNDINDVNDVDDEDDYILSPNKNPRFFSGLCEMCGRYYPDLPSNENWFTQEDLNQITLINSDDNCCSYFQDVTSLDELQYFHNLEIIEIYSFKSCKELKSIILPKSLQKINSNAFNKCISLKEIIIPENIKFISLGSFLNCENLEKIIIPEKFKNDMENIFYQVDLTKVNITYI